MYKNACELPRLVSRGQGFFGGVALHLSHAVRRADDTVLVRLESGLPAAELVKLYESLRALGAARLELGNAICRAKAVDWDAALGAIVFELHSGVSHEVYASNAASNGWAQLGERKSASTPV